MRLQLECESRTASIPAADLSSHLDVTVSLQRDFAYRRSSGEAKLNDSDNNDHRFEHSDEDTEGHWWASDDDDDMVFQLSDIDHDDVNGGTNSWADDTIQAVNSPLSLLWNGSFVQRIGDPVPPSFDDDSGNGYSCDSGSPCRAECALSVPFV